MKRALTGLVALLLAASLPATAQGAPPAGPLAPPAGSAITPNLHAMGFSENTGTFNTDLAFWGNYAIQGNFEGFRILDISAPANPKVVVDYEECVGGSFAGGQGDVVVYGDILVRAWDAPAPAAGVMCGEIFTPGGQQGLHIFDISNPKDPVAVAFINVPGGSHTMTGVPDPENNRLLIYNSSSDASRMGIDIVEIPLDDPASPALLGFEPAGRHCHDVGVILGDAMLAACAGMDGFTVWTLAEGVPQDGTLDNPAFLYMRSVDGVTIGHSVAFSNDGDTIIFGHEPGGGVSAFCEGVDAEVDRTLFFFDARTGVEVGRWTMTRIQSATENCTLHNYNVVPTDKRDILVMGNYQSGIAVLDFTDTSNVVEIAYFDPPPLNPNQLVLGGDWSAYWYNGFIYESDITRGLRVWNLSDSAVAGARKLPFLNPQTTMNTIERRSEPDRGLTGSFRLVGHNDLLARGMNAALSVHNGYAYIGSRTDGDPGVTDPALCAGGVCAKNAGLMIVDVKNPANPTIAAQIGPPREGNDRESTREMRVWRSQNILAILHTNCAGNGAHNCEGGSLNGWRFYNIAGANATDPQLIASLDSGHDTHEFFLWEDPNNPNRALMYGGNAGSGNTAFRVWDISPLLSGLPPVRIYQASPGYPSTAGKPSGSLHSLSVSNDGNEAYFALLTGGFAVADTSDFAEGVAAPVRVPVTVNASRPTWPGPGAHSAVKFWGRDYVWVTDEVYGEITGSAHGCPWGWARVIDISNRAAPVVVAEYKEPQNHSFLCSEFQEASTQLHYRTAFSAHNPTLTPNIAFTAWHSNGLQATSLEDPRYPYQLAEFMSDVRPATVDMEDPRLSSDPETGLGEKTVSWSYPVIVDGLIYVADLRNGLYILDYDGRFDDEVDSIGFLEGNSNQGDALCFEPVGAAPAYCD